MPSTRTGKVTSPSTVPHQAGRRGRNASQTRKHAHDERPSNGVETETTRPPDPSSTQARPRPRMPSLRAEYASNPALTDALRARCSLPPSLINHIRTLAADAQLGTALRVREQAHLHPRGGQRQGDDDDDAQGATAPSHQRDSKLKAAIPQAGPNEHAASSSTHPVDHEEQEDGQVESSGPVEDATPTSRTNKRRKLSHRTSSAIISNGDDDADQRNGQPSASSWRSSITTPGVGVHIQARLLDFDASIPPAFRLLHQHSYSSAGQTFGESAISQPTLTRKVDTSAARSSAHPIERPAYIEGEPKADQLIYRLAISSTLHAGGSKPQRRPGGSSTTAAASPDDLGTDTQPVDILAGQEVEVLGSTPLSALAEVIICPSHALSRSTTALAARGQANQMAVLEQGATFLVCGGRVYLPKRCSDEEEDAALQMSFHAGLVESASPASIENMDDVKLADLATFGQQGQHAYLLHADDCVHLVALTSLYVRTATEAPSTAFPRTLSVPHAALRHPVASMMTRKRHVPHILAPMVCEVCESWPAQGIIIGGADAKLKGDVQEVGGQGVDGAQVRKTVLLDGVGDEALAICAGCWAACGGEVTPLHDVALNVSTSPPSIGSPSIGSSRDNASAARVGRRGRGERGGAASSSQGRGGRLQAGHTTDDVKTATQGDAHAGDSPTPSSQGEVKKRRHRSDNSVKTKMQIVLPQHQSRQSNPDGSTEGSDDKAGWHVVPLL